MKDLDVNGRPFVYCAIDSADLGFATDLATKLPTEGVGLKIGLEFFCSNGIAGVQKVLEAKQGQKSLFLDLKFHDIPNTVASVVKATSGLVKPDFMNVHAAGGADMMKAAKDACQSDTKILAVTVLTSLDEENLKSVGQKTPVADQVKRLAVLAKESGMDGIVCSPLEIELIRAELGDDFILMVPGIRPEGSAVGDQKRIMTPAKAHQCGASHIVIGRPISKAPDPAQAAKEILASIFG